MKKTDVLLIMFFLFSLGVTANLIFFAEDLRGLQVVIAEAKEMAQGEVEIRESSTVRDLDDNILAYLSSSGYRDNIKIKDIPEGYVDVLLSVEDKKFYEHKGVNYLALVRAFKANLKEGEVRQGGSTITLQLAKNLYLTPEQTYKRKIQEMFIALEMEKKYEKEKILEMYLNESYFGRNAYGIKMASKAYFNKSVEDLTKSEFAYLIGCLQAPSTYSQEEAGLKRFRLVKAILAEDGIDVKEEDLEFENGEVFYRGDFYLDEVIRVVEQDLKVNPKQESVTIYTDYNRELQERVQDVVMSWGGYPKGVGDEIPEVGLVVVENKTGKPIAMVGARKYTSMGLNRATQTFRQPGSTVKPILVYPMGIEKGMGTDTRLIDMLITYKGVEEDWTPVNYDAVYRGRVPLEYAVALSINSTAVQVADYVGMSEIIHLAGDLGMSKVGFRDANLALALGGMENGVSVMEMAQAYSTFARNGRYKNASIVDFVENEKGEYLYIGETEDRQVFSERTNTLMLKSLKAVTEYGTGSRARVQGVEVAGKTGTTDNVRDLWFVGMTPDYTCAVWVGFDNNHRMSGLTSSTLVPLWNEVMGIVNEVNGIENTSFGLDINKVYEFNRGKTIEWVDPYKLPSALLERVEVEADIPKNNWEETGEEEEAPIEEEVSRDMGYEGYL